MSTEKERWAKLAGLPEPTDKQQLDENFVGMGMVGNIFDREKEQYEDAFEHFLSERYENPNDEPDDDEPDWVEDENSSSYPSHSTDGSPEDTEMPSWMREEKVEEELATSQQLDLSSLKSNIIRATQSFENKEELKKYLLGLVGELEDDLFGKEK